MGLTGCGGAAKGVTSAEVTEEREAEMKARQEEVMNEEAAHRSKK